MIKGRSLTVILIGIGIALMVWVGAVRPRNGEAQQIFQTPLAGPHVAPLESIQPVLFHVRFDPAGKIRAVVFRGMTSDKNIRQFAQAHALVQITNDVARTRILSNLAEWNLDTRRFPIFNRPNDLCFTGSLANDKLLIQIAHRPGDDRFTALAIPNAVSTAGPPQN